MDQYWITGLIAAGALVGLFGVVSFLRGRSEQARVKALSRFAAMQTTVLGRVWGVQLDQASDADLERLIGLSLPGLAAIGLKDGKISNGGIEQLGKVATLRQQNLRGTSLSPKALEMLTGFRGLERLGLEETGAEFKDVKALEQAIQGVSINY